MNTDIYKNTVPLFSVMLENLYQILEKAEKYSTEKMTADKKPSEDFLLNYRLFPDMFPFIMQVQIACDNAKGATARLAGIDIPKFEDNEKTFAELKTRVQKTKEFVDNIKEEQFTKADTRKIELPYVPGKHLLGDEYIKRYAVPNFLFHLATAYNILRHNGLEIGKGDYIGKLNWIEN